MCPECIAGRQSPTRIRGVLEVLPWGGGQGGAANDGQKAASLILAVFMNDEAE